MSVHELPTETITDEDVETGDAQEARPLGIQWHPDALRPAFDWIIKLPPDWLVIETHPARWKIQNERIVDDFFTGQRVPSKVRRALLRSLEEVVSQAQRNKVLLTLLKPGINEDGSVANTALSLTFSSTTPRLSSMAPIQRAFAPGVLHRTHHTDRSCVRHIHRPANPVRRQ
ncbi:hypothetical protein GII30_23150 [Gordonia amarae]|mgnify:CR=1 FL=1|uniref:Uncharacterized protein n=2 Tax=Gordonia amarae TaxID=36821 RepID=G7GJY9_9ACTN|nr:hypothetical protein [Gordonia amarae]MCS3876683.1 hypothetical protein [Gordonia amarae]QHN19561.1 hypothetical protein GII35_23600 [Gordonia amarae]QHN24030.1 hypothetical protein GII34_23065 [Gordonia amarae]QHN32948.1 hypothetical protein GII32_23435 [Gordonia amarae]QHN41668.1 hypothetical protein GII30_23150 [Gordonia amarae]